jgi:hypothetical protein
MDLLEAVSQHSSAASQVHCYASVRCMVVGQVRLCIVFVYLVLLGACARLDVDGFIFRVTNIYRMYLRPSNRFRNAQLIIGREHESDLSRRLKVWQKEFFCAFRARRRFIVSATVVVHIRVRRDCSR